MNPQNPTPELSRAIEPLKPEILRAIGFSTVISLLALAPTADTDGGLGLRRDGAS